MKLIHNADTHLSLVGEVSQNLDNEKNSKGFGEIGEMHRHFDNEKIFSKIFEEGGFVRT